MVPDAPETVSRMVTHTGPVFRVESLEVRDSTGRVFRRDVVRHPGAVTTVAELADGRLVLVRNKRIAVGRELLEFCAGKLERGEDPAAAAARELEEECGYRAARVEPIGTYFTSPGFADERMHAFVATGLEPIPRRLEPGEELEVEVLPADEVERRIADGRIEDGKSIAAFFLWRLRRSRGAGA
jgi:ADP-ribose pyrophosphatase